MVEEKNTFRSVLIREVGKSLHFPVMTDLVITEILGSVNLLL